MSKRYDFSKFAVDAIPAQGARIDYKKVMQKINDGEWEAEQDVKPRKYVQMRDTRTNKRFTIWVE